MPKIARISIGFPRHETGHNKMKCDLHSPVINEISARLGRPLRVLHIGNIANNAYNNARIQRQYGIEADVICHDYYHVMAAPEWEDGGLTTPLDPYLPNWWASNLKGFRRPDWYVQGPLPLCLDYLDAKQRGQKMHQKVIQWAIEDAYLDLLRRNTLLHGRVWRNPRVGIVRNKLLPPLVAVVFPPSQTWTGFKLSVLGVLRAITSLLLLKLHARVIAVPSRYLSHKVDLSTLVLWPLLAAAVAKPPSVAFARQVIGGYGLLRRLMRQKVLDFPEIEQRAATAIPKELDLSWSGSLVRLARILVAMAANFALAPFYPVTLLLERLIGLRKLNDSVVERENFAEEVICRLEAFSSNAQLETRAEKSLPTSYASRPGPMFPPERRDQLKAHIIHHTLLFGPLLKHYDIIQGYSIDGFIPMVNNHPAFASYEHGTLRELPFEDSLTGVICRIAYAHSPAVFVTNTDVLPSVERLGLDPMVVHNLPHAFDDRKLMDWRDAHPSFAPPSGEVVFFSPTRQHWRDDNPSLTKGNDIMLRAAGKLWAEGRRFRIVMVEWGEDIDATRALIEKIGFCEAVQWVPPMGKQDLWRAYCTSHAVLDQFTLPALGGVGFEALALGCRLISHTDQPVLARFFGEAPPVLPAASVEQVTDSMRRVLNDPDDTDGIGAAGRIWIDKHHSARLIVEVQGKVYAQLLTKRI